MKKVILAAMAACAIFASCSKEGVINKEEVEMKSLSVRLPDNIVLGTRSVEAPIVSNSTTTLNDVTVFLLNGNSVVLVEIFDPSEILAKIKHIRDVPSNVNGVLVVGNIPSADQTAVKALTSAVAIEGYNYTLAGQSSAAGITDKLHMGSSSIFTLITPNPISGSTNDYYLVTVTLDAITARFEIGDVTAGTGIANIKLEGVWINNYLPSWAVTTPTLITDDPTAMTPPLLNYWATSPTTNTIGSAASLTPVAITNPYAPTEYYDAYSSQVNGTSHCYAYMLFAGNYVPHVIMLVSGEYATGFYTGTNKYFLGWVTFTKFTNTDIIPYADLTSLEANKIYKALGGIVIDAKNITTNPEQEGFDLGVDITIAPWTVVNVVPGV